MSNWVQLNICSLRMPSLIELYEQNHLNFNNINLVKELIQQGANINEKDNYDRAPLH